ncbi:acyl-CoA N-acyltransferase [Neocallimastix californiae]|uniref:Acyl-CoA N-acyltransferase n=1 Tax=Neocallimastix californiae TaxID=1754190 RepID=A0A1Y2D4H5_9FUNG|nr:acyl-CoA N-acyltransferase [Neocallimastix californiae]|eukprot:ORY54127.1 acyl-CoA N-acyltransferase [Neocallimastix californiae]
MFENNSHSHSLKSNYTQTLLFENSKRRKEDIDQKDNNFDFLYDNDDIVTSNNSITAIGNELSTEVTVKKRVIPILQQVTKDNINDLRTVYALTFPLTYTSDFYSDILNIYPKELSRVAIYNNVVVGGICCRLEKKSLRDIKQEFPKTSTEYGLSFTQQINKLNSLKLINSYSCYIMAIAILEPYQNLSIGSELMSYIINYCENNENISSINLHVHVKNEKAIKFYKKYGFYEKDFIKGYYYNPNIIPPDVYYFQKDLK